MPALLTYSDYGCQMKAIQRVIATIRVIRARGASATLLLRTGAACQVDTCIRYGAWRARKIYAFAAGRVIAAAAEVTLLAG